LGFKTYFVADVEALVPNYCLKRWIFSAATLF